MVPVTNDYLAAEREGRRIGGFGTGGLGSGINGGMLNNESWELRGQLQQVLDVESAKETKIGKKVEAEPDIECPNCKEMFASTQVVVHTV